MQELPTALVLHWSANSVRVKCPFCLSSHGHGIGDPRRRYGERRSADCYHISGRKSYQILYPDEESDFTIPFGWELDKEERVIYTVTHKGRLSDPLSLSFQPRRLLDEYRNLSQQRENDRPTAEDEDAIADSLDDMNLSDSENVGDTLAEQLKDPSFRKKLYISDCCFKDIKDLELLFQRYPEDLFANAVCSEGNNGILLVSKDENGLDTIKWLEKKGVSIHEGNHYGRTALMEAALWGHLETVQYLIDNGASISAVDANGHRASDLAADSERNEEERISRANGAAMVRLDANRKRRQILALLMGRETISQGPLDGANQPQISQGYFDKISPNLLWYYKADTSYDIGGKEKNKAFGRLDRGPRYPVISAMSGYSQGHRQDVLNNEIWTEKAQKLCRMIGFDDSQSYASHVERQLIAYYMDRHHWIFEEDGCSSSSFLAVLPSPPPAIITVNKLQECSNCLAFKAKFHEYFSNPPVKIVCVGETIKRN
ncbi:hypothetical protein VE00_07462 [Pseudogymnoascus sp. WSF 3629]|nr:hypothetical protein VE00_07462 [Pseudogymnoascus sp. WSF 3629]